MRLRACAHRARGRRGRRHAVGPAPAARRGPRDRRRGARAGRAARRRRHSRRERAGPPGARRPRPAARPIELGIARDELADVRARLERGIREADLVIVSGGVSVGPYDVVRLAFDALGSIDLWRVAVQPGKPFAFGLGAAAVRWDAVPLFGLPGNPVSSFVTFELFVRPGARRPRGRDGAAPPRRPGRLCRDRHEERQAGGRSCGCRRARRARCGAARRRRAARSCTWRAARAGRGAMC